MFMNEQLKVEIRLTRCHCVYYNVAILKIHRKYIIQTNIYNVKHIKFVWILYLLNAKDKNARLIFQVVATKYTDVLVSLTNKMRL